VERGSVMNWRFVLVDHGLETGIETTGIYKILRHQTARLMNEFGQENIEIFDNIEDAKEAAVLMVKRHEEAVRQNHTFFEYQPDPKIEKLKNEISELTVDRVQEFFV
jgi:hypothetical protein